MRTSPLLYLACPYWNSLEEIREERVRMANYIAGKLSSKGVMVYSPLSHGPTINSAVQNPPPEAHWRDHGIIMLSRCDAMAILILEGVQESEGVKLEVSYATTAKLPIFMLHTGGLIDWSIDLMVKYLLESTPNKAAQPTTTTATPQTIGY